MESVELTAEENFLTDLAQGAISGATTGSVAGPWGALVGALAGAGISAVQSAGQQQRPPAATPRPSPAAPLPAIPRPPTVVAPPRPPAPAQPTAGPAPSGTTPAGLVPSPTAAIPAPVFAQAGPSPAPAVAVPASTGGQSSATSAPAGFDLQQLLPAILSLAQTLGGSFGGRTTENVEPTNLPSGADAPLPSSYRPPPGAVAAPVVPSRSAPEPTLGSMHGHMMESARYAEAAEMVSAAPQPPRLFGAATWALDEAEAWDHDEAWSRDDGEAWDHDEAWSHDDGEAVWSLDDESDDESDGESDDEFDDESAEDDEALPFECTWVR